jgi:tRNA threonylcarbamoyladenosine biosynthesis protein TsaB
MILLAIDTSGKQGSIALARVPGDACSSHAVEVIEVVPLEGGTFSAQLIPQVSALLERHRFTKGDLDGFAVASGPGSFTGLRVGLSAVKALAEVLQKPIAVVSLLEALARTSSRDSVLAVLDAGRGEVYVGEYELRNPTATGSERLLSRQEFLECASAPVVTSDRTIADAVRAAGLQVDLVAYPGTPAVARIGWEKLHAGDTVEPGALEANYIRRSDAEIFSTKK